MEGGKEYVRKEQRGGGSTEGGVSKGETEGVSEVGREYREEVRDGVSK